MMLLIYIFAIINVKNFYNKQLVLYGINNPVRTHSYPVDIVSSG